jgi:hypothetical protein
MLFRLTLWSMLDRRRVRLVVQLMARCPHFHGKRLCKVIRVIVWWSAFNLLLSMFTCHFDLYPYLWVLFILKGLLSGEGTNFVLRRRLFCNELRIRDSLVGELFVTLMLACVSRVIWERVLNSTSVLWVRLLREEIDPWLIVFLIALGLQLNILFII